MGTGYTRNDTANNIADGNVINAADFDGEYDAIEAAFNSSTGHTHDGTAAEGGPITVLGPNQEFVASASAVAPSTNAGIDIGTTSLKFKDLYIDGTAYIDGLGGNLLVDTTNAIQFRDTALSISSSADGQLDIAADTTAKITSPEVIVTDDFRLQSDAAILTFGADDDVTVTHVADTGLDAQAASGFTLRLQTGDTTVESGNTIGKISFNAPDEASGTDAVLVGAEIEAAAEATFSSTVNSTALVFKTNDSAAATERMRIKANGDIVIKGNSYDVTWDASADAFITDSNNDIKFQPHGTGSVAITGALDVDNININGNSIISTDTNGDINITPNGTGKVNVSGGFVPSEVSLTSDDAGAAKGPQLDVFRNSASPADGDAIGYVDFSANDSDANKTVYASILAEAADVTDTTEDGTLKFNTMVAGTDTTIMTMKDGWVGIGTTSPEAELHIADTAANATLRIESSNTGFGNIFFDDNATNIGQIRYDHSVNDMIFGTSGAERLRIDTSGRVLINHDTPETVGSQSARIQVNGLTASDAAISIVRWDAGSNAPKIAFGKSRSASIGTNTVVQDGDALGQITFSGDDGSDLSQIGAEIKVSVDGTPAANSIPSEISFRTVANGGTSLGERMLITNAGKVGIGTGTPLSKLHVHVGDVTDNFSGVVIEGDSSGSSSAPDLNLYRNSSSPADGDNIGALWFYGKDSGDNDTLYAGIVGIAEDVTDATENGAIHFNVNTGNDLNTVGKFDGSGRFLVGTTTARTLSTVPSLQVEGTNASDSAISITRNSNDASGPTLRFGKSRSGGIGSNALVSNGDNLGSIYWLPADGTDSSSFAAGIWAAIDNTPGSNDVPARLVFATTSDGSDNVTERMRITSAGLVGIGESANIISKLHVSSSLGNTYSSTAAVQGQQTIRIANTSHTNAGYAAFQLVSENASGIGGFWNICNVSSSSNYQNVLAFQTRVGSSTYAERMRLDGSGFLLVGKLTSASSGRGIEIRDGKSASGFAFTATSDYSGAIAVLTRTSTAGMAGAHILLRNKTSGGTVTNSLELGQRVAGSSPIGYVEFNKAVSDKAGLTGTSAGPAVLPAQSGGTADNVVDLGFSSVRFDDIYATNSTIQTSDQNEKQQIASLTDAEITAAKAISKLFKTFKWNSAVTKKGDAARTHAGVIAQDVEQAMTDAGLNASDYAFFIDTTWWEVVTDVPEVIAQDAVYEDVAVPAVLDDEGNELEPATTERQLVTEAVEAREAYTQTEHYNTADEAPEGAVERNRKGIRYPELLAFIGAATEQRLASIESRLDALESA